MVALVCGQIVAALGGSGEIAFKPALFAGRTERQLPVKSLCLSVVLAHILQQYLPTNSNSSMKRSKRGSESRHPRCRNNKRSVTFEIFRFFILDTYIQDRREQHTFIHFHISLTASRFGDGTHALPLPSRWRVALVTSVRTIINRLLLAQRIGRWRSISLQISDGVFAF